MQGEMRPKQHCIGDFNVQVGDTDILSRQEISY